MSRAKEHLEYIRHTLVTSHGLVVADGASPAVNWDLDLALAITRCDLLAEEIDRMEAELDE